MPASPGTFLEEPLNEMLSFHYETTWYNAFSRLIAALCPDPSYDSLALESFLSPPHEVNLARVISSYM